MKKWMYLIAPGIMLGLFLFVYFGHVEKTHAKEKAKAEKIAMEKADAERKKVAAETKAREDAKKRQDERDAEEKKKADEKAAKQAADDKKVKDQTNEYTAKANAAGKKVADLEKQLATMRSDKEKLIRETFDLAKAVELARIARRNAELEIQRMTEMVTRRASDSSLTKPPAMPAPPPAPAKGL